MALLTTVIPVYNGERFLPFTLEAVACQSRRPDRVVVLDNCSTDRTCEIVNKFSALPCEWRQNERNIGLLGNLNRALSFATETDYLHLLMADDLIKPGFYERLTQALEPGPGRSLAYSYNEVIDTHGARTGLARELPSGQTREISRNRFLSRQVELDTVLLPAVVFKTVRRPSPCLFQDLPQVADCLFLAEWARACERLIEVPDYLCQYRLHPASATSNSNLFNVQSTVLDEWKVITAILPWIEEPAPLRWLREQKLRCLFAARTQVKMDMAERVREDYARELRHVIRKTVGPFYTGLGRLAVRARDLADSLRGREARSVLLARSVGLDPRCKA